MTQNGRWRITASGDFWVVRWGRWGPWDCEAGELQKIYIVKTLKYPTVRRSKGRFKTEQT